MRPSPYARRQYGGWQVDGTSFFLLWSDMEEDGFVDGGDEEEMEAIQELYPEVCAALDRRKAQMMPETVFEGVEEVTEGHPLSPERYARILYAAEWYVKRALPGHRCSFPELRGPVRSDHDLSRSYQFAMMLQDEDDPEPPEDPAEFAFFPSPEEVWYALHLSVSPVTVNVVYGAVTNLYRTFGVFPDFPTLIERLQQRPMTLSNGYTWIWYVWRVMADLYQVIHDRMQEVLDAAGK